jgi:hypothetical protein
MTTRTTVTSIKRLFFTLFILGVLGFGALFTHVNKAFASSCAPVDATAHGIVGFAQTDQIDQVVASGNVNVRHSPGTSSTNCIITTQAPTANVVVVPNTAQVWANNLWWTEVLYFQHNPRTATNYDWSHAGWMASEFLTKATHGFQCFSSGCEHFSAKGPPSDPDLGLGELNSCESTVILACEPKSLNFVWQEPQPNDPFFPDSNTWGAWDQDPNWFIDARINLACASQPPNAQCPSWEFNSFWNWDWTAF